MPATNITFDQLFGSNSQVMLLRESPLDDKMRFAFNSFNAVFITGMGTRGHEYEFSGIIRTSAQTSAAAAVAEFNGIIANASNNGIADYKDAATLLSFAADSGQLATLIKGSAGAQLSNVVIDRFDLTGPRQYSREGSNWRVTAPFAMLMVRLV